MGKNELLMCIVYCQDIFTSSLSQLELWNFLWFNNLVLVVVYYVNKDESSIGAVKKIK